MALSLASSTQSVVDRYVKSMGAVRGLFDLYEQPRPKGRPPKRYRPLPSAIVQGTTAAFEAFAEDLLVVALMHSSTSWAQVAAHANLTNPSLYELNNALKGACGIDVNPGSAWKLKMWWRSGQTAWYENKATSWDDLVEASRSWIQVRHCLTHGITTGTEPSKWSDPVKAKATNKGSLPHATAVLAPASDGKFSLTLYPAVNCSLVFSEGAAVVSKAVASAVGQNVDTGALEGMFRGI